LVPSIDFARRRVVGGGLGSAVAAVLGIPFGGCASGPVAAGPLIGFKSVPPSTADAVRVPDGYVAELLIKWGEPVGVAGALPPMTDDASSSAADQAVQSGMHHDGMHYFAIPGADPNRRGVLATNHEYTDEGLLHAGGHEPVTAEKVRKSQHAVGVSVVEVERAGDGWRVVRPSPYARRIHAATPMRIAGPCAGNAIMRTPSDPTGTRSLGTLNNCAHGYTPWGTYLTCEENFQNYFANGDEKNADHRRAGIGRRSRYGWERFDDRFDLAKQPNEVNRFGWVVEIDPLDPASTPVKHTGLGRWSHEVALVHVARNGRVVVYMGDDRRNEFVYKFVSRHEYRGGLPHPGTLDEGTLYVARFEEGGRGRWLPLVHGLPGLTPDKGFADQAEVLVKARLAGTVVGATPMDRPEWLDLQRSTGDVYVTLTNNADRGKPGMPGTGPGNPRANNVFGHILRWREDGLDHTSLTFAWEVFILAGDPALADPGKKGDVNGDAFGSPDGLWFDPRGVLWIQTDISTSLVGEKTGDYANLGNNVMLACDPSSREVRRFLTGPNKCEITGVVTTPDQRTMFVNIQHPGETNSEFSDPAAMNRLSSWPDGPGRRPRSATIVIRRLDGGVVGT
jgi:secreted PhoX family phosphatase